MLNANMLRVLVLVFAACFASVAVAAPRNILLYGDSLLAGLGLDAAGGFEAQLQGAMDEAGIEATLINASVSGDTTADGLERLEWTLGGHPDAVILGLGANDMLRGLPAAETRRNLEAILARMEELNLPVLLLGMKADRALGADYVQAFDAIYPDLAKRHGAVLYPFYLQAIGLDQQYFQSDLRHPNIDGVACIVADLLPTVRKLVEKIH